MKILIVVDMQNDFVDGPLGTEEAKKIVPNIVEKIGRLRGSNTVFFTQDTHFYDYLTSQEGQKLPMIHCVEETPGWCIIGELAPYAHYLNNRAIRKYSFGCDEWKYYLDPFIEDDEDKVTSIELVGCCTDICVISNALIIKSLYPEIPIDVDASCCAGTTPEMHEKALDIMRSCQINVR